MASNGDPSIVLQALLGVLQAGGVLPGLAPQQAFQLKQKVKSGVRTVSKLSNLIDSAKYMTWMLPTTVMVKKGALDTLPQAIGGESDLEALQAKFLLHEAISINATPNKNVKLENRNPRNTGTLVGWTYEVDCHEPLIRLRYYCSGRPRQDCTPNPDQYCNKKKKKCQVELNILIYVGYFEIYLTGAHGANFKPNQLKRDLTYKEKQIIQDLDSCGSKTFYGNTTAALALASIGEKTDSIPSMDCVSNRLKSSRRAKKGKNTDFDLLLAFVKEPCNLRFVIWHNLEDYHPQESPLIVVVLSSEYLLGKMTQYCKTNVGMMPGGNGPTNPFQFGF